VRAGEGATPLLAERRALPTEDGGVGLGAPARPAGPARSQENPDLGRAARSELACVCDRAARDDALREADPEMTARLDLAGMGALPAANTAEARTASEGGM
jgi:hypothetical protein